MDPTRRGWGAIKSRQKDSIYRFNAMPYILVHKWPCRVFTWHERGRLSEFETSFLYFFSILFQIISLNINIHSQNIINFPKTFCYKEKKFDIFHLKFTFVTWNCSFQNHCFYNFEIWIQMFSSALTFRKLFAYKIAQASLCKCSNPTGGLLCLVTDFSKCILKF